MIYKRKEAFRYVFNPPLSCSFSIVSIDNKRIKSGIGQGEIIDISPTGIKLSSLLDIPVEQKVSIKLGFRINEDLIEADGLLIWKKMNKVSVYNYGVKFLNTAVMGKLITNELKVFIENGKNQ